MRIPIRESVVKQQKWTYSQTTRLMLSPGNRTPPKLRKLIDTLLTPDKNVQA